MTIFSYVVLIQGSELYINIVLQKINVMCQVLIALKGYEIIKDHLYAWSHSKFTDSNDF